MKFTLPQQSLLRAATFAASGIEGRSALPILSHLKIEATDKITILGTNLQLSAEATAEAEIKSKGAACLPAHLFLSFVKSAPGETIEMELGKKVTMKSGRAKAEMAYLSADEFPKCADVKGVTVEIDGIELKEKLGIARRAASDDSSRYILNSTLFEFEEGVLTVVSTDGKRLSAEQVKCDGSGHYTLPSALVDRLCSALSTGKVQCTFSDTHAKFQGKDWALDGKLIDGPYPNWRLPIPKVEQFVSVNTEALRSIIQRSMPFTTEKAHSVKIQFKPTELLVSSGDGDNQFADAIECKSDVDLQLAVNPLYFLDALAGVGPQAKIGLIDDRSPLVFLTDSFTGIVMPMRCS